MSAVEAFTLNEDPGDEMWRERARCRGVDPAIFYPEKELGETADEALSICAKCPVMQACLEYALAHNEKFGVWGGMTERERYNLRKARQRQT